jgi:hypothetical protein
MQQPSLDEYLSRLAGLPAEEIDAIEKTLNDEFGDMAWTPQPGPQTDAFFCEADELFYGGEAGGGKTDLLVGLALTGHNRSLILRRTNNEARKLVDRFEEVLGTRDGLAMSPTITWRYKDKIIDLGGCEQEEDKKKRQGIAHDLKAFDEITNFTESQYLYITIWNRTTLKGQRCRTVVAGNPPTDPQGYWVLKRWAAWLDPAHPNPARSGEIRYFITDEKGNDVEVEGRGPHLVGGRQILARSRCFIRAKVTDNIYQTKEYITLLDNLPPQERAAFRDGRFDLALRDAPDQMIPTQWVLAAQARWTELPPQGVPMCALAADVTGGGADDNVIAKRHDAWYAPLTVIEGEKTPYGEGLGGHILKERRDKAVIIIDMGGGYGNRPYGELQSNGIEPPILVGYKGGSTSNGHAEITNFSFANKRAESWWRFREALDPTQEGGSRIALPPDAQLVSDLSAPTYKVINNEIKMETKEKLVERLGRSPDRGDAVVMCWSAGPKIMDSWDQWRQNTRHSNTRRSTQYATSYAARKGIR